MLHNLICFMKGYLRIRLSGDAIERFINACSHKGINLWNLSSQKSFYEMNITVKDLKKIKPVIRKTKTKVIIVKRTGFPFFIQKYQKRKLFFAGFVFCIFMIFLLSEYIWNINITGNSIYTTENMLCFLDSINIRKGIKSSQVECTEINRQIRQNYNDIIWVSASIEGTNLNIEVKENEDSKDFRNKKNENKNSPYSIVSDHACQITKLVIRNGISMVKEGDYVKKDDLLISGQIPVYNDAGEIIDYQYCVSDADIYGKSKIQYTDHLSLFTTQKKYHNITKQEYYMQIGKYRFSLGSIKNDYRDCEVYSTKKKKGLLSWGIRSVYPYKAISIKYTDQQMQELLSSNFQYYCNELEKKGVAILQNDVKIYTWSDKACAKGTLTIEMPVGQKIKAELVEIGDKIDGNDGNND